ncbi:MAG: winged helix-turn-helix domain-containing protein [Candidatus Omnitrophica bacterium]|nr:winged helix-turn-helix domain-containing protein [Candidatus Omnitrophota bacterium]
MKDKIIEVAGKTWRYLGQNGQTNVSRLVQSLKEKDEIVLQALGWLAREDKIAYTVKNRRTFVSLVEGELHAFNSIVYKINEQASSANSGSGNGKPKTRK